MPHVGLCVAIVWSAAELVKLPRLPAWALPTTLAAVVTTLLILTQWQLSHWRNSITLWSHAIAIDPSNPISHGKLADSLKDIGQFGAAELHYRKALGSRLALKDDPAWISARNNLAVVLVASGKIAEARQHLKQSRGWAQSDVDSVLELSLLLLGSGNAAEAAKSTREAIELSPGDARAYFLHGRALANQGLLEAAAEAYKQALQIDPENIQTLNDFATLLARQKRFDEAIPIYRSIIARDPSAEAPRRNLARALEEQARHAQQESQPSPATPGLR